MKNLKSYLDKVPNYVYVIVILVLGISQVVTGVRLSKVSTERDNAVLMAAYYGVNMVDNAGVLMVLKSNRSYYENYKTSASSVSGFALVFYDKVKNKNIKYALKLTASYTSNAVLAFNGMMNGNKYEERYYTSKMADARNQLNRLFGWSGGFGK